MSLDSKQSEAVHSDARDVLCDSKAGSGKTRTIAYRCKHLLSTGVPASKILLITFTNKAANEMKERIESLTKQDRILCGTFHSIGMFFIRKYAYLLGINSNFSIITPDDSAKKIGESIKLISKRPDMEFHAKDLKPKKIQAIYSTARNFNKPLKEYLEEQSFTYGQIDVILEAVQDFNVYKSSNSMLDFDDILDNFYKLLTIEQAHSEITRQYNHILVDEFQDVNYIQYQIIVKLRDDDKKSNSLFLVGDPCQCIYEFRGSNISYINNFPKLFKAHVISLDYNYRSYQEILDVGADVTCGRTRMTSKIGTGGAPILKVVDSEFLPYNQCKDVAQQIEYLIKNKVPPSEIAVLVKSSILINFLEKELIGRDIKYVLRAGYSFFEKAHIKDMVALLTLFINRTNTLALERILSLMAGVGATTITKIIELYTATGYLKLNEFIPLPKVQSVLSKRSKASLNEFVILYEKLDKEVTLEDKMRLFMSEFYNHHLTITYDAGSEIEDRTDDLETLCLMAEEKKSITDIEFLNSIMIDSSLNSKGKKLKAGEEAIVVSTIHRAKGLEWDNVFICSFCSQSVSRDELSTADIGPDERLAYVAITRAKKRLVIYATKEGFNKKINNRGNLSHVFANIRCAKIQLS